MTSSVLWNASGRGEKFTEQQKKQGAEKLPVKPHGKHRDDCESSSLFFRFNPQPGWVDGAKVVKTHQRTKRITLFNATLTFRHVYLFIKKKATELQTAAFLLSQSTKTLMPLPFLGCPDFVTSESISRISRMTAVCVRNSANTAVSPDWLPPSELAALSRLLIA